MESETLLVDTSLSDEEATPSKEFWLTTTDNPYDPFTEFESWLAYDEQTGYFTNGLLARLCLDSPNFSDEQNDLEIFKAMKNICDLFPGLYTIRYQS